MLPCMLNVAMFECVICTTCSVHKDCFSWYSYLLLMMISIFACCVMTELVLVSTQEHCDRLVAARLACDIMGTNTIIVARTDAEAATLLDSNIDKRDHPFILGVTNPSAGSLQDALAKVGPGNHDTATKEWEVKANLRTFGDAVLEKINSIPDGRMRQSMLNAWNAADPDTLSNADARRVADRLFGRDNSIYFGKFTCHCSVVPDATVVINAALTTPVYSVYISCRLGNVSRS